jgi:hypothetical protein
MYWQSSLLQKSGSKTTSILKTIEEEEEEEVEAEIVMDGITSTYMSDRFRLSPAEPKYEMRLGEDKQCHIYRTLLRNIHMQERADGAVLSHLQRN